MRDIVFRPRAEADLEAIADYSTAKWGDAQAKRYIADIYHQIESVADMPGIGSSVFSLPPEYRKVRSGRHRVIYRHEAPTLIVIRIVHEREDVAEEE
jgi:toxin ParE1/3/4